MQDIWDMWKATNTIEVLEQAGTPAIIMVLKAKEMI
jgi:hypothetical protein